jgi:hypothetical protein
MNGEGAAAPQLGFDADAPAVRFDDMFDQTQTQPLP